MIGPILVFFEICQMMMIPGLLQYFLEKENLHKEVTTTSLFDVGYWEGMYAVHDFWIHHCSSTSADFSDVKFISEGYFEF